jgi:signal transduction histidine kinase
LVDELLDVSRIESGRVEFHLAPIDLYELVAEVVGRMRMTTDRHTLTLTGVGPGRAIVSADHDHIEQVMNNLISNAIKYSPAGGEVAISVETDGATARVSVRDWGVGVPQSELESIFGLFYRVQEGEARHVGGMGLGLYISREIVTRHGGRVWAESAPGQGSTFHVELPSLSSSSRPSAEPALGTHDART